MESRTYHPLLRTLGSLRLTVFLLAASLVLVFFGTLDQMTLGINEVQRRYFESLLVFYPQPMIRIGLPGIYWGGILPIPGGYLLGSLLMVNLISAHWMYFKPQWRKLGISLIHGGVLLLILSAFVNSFVQRESNMAITEGEAVNYSFTQRKNELVFSKSSENADIERKEVRIPFERLKKGEALSDEALPVVVEIDHVHANANLYPDASKQMLRQLPGAYKSSANRGAAARMNIAVRPRRKDFSQEAINTATAVVTLKTKNGETLGTWLVSNVFNSQQVPPQTFSLEGETWSVKLRFKRYYKDYWVRLNDVTHDVYPGTETPKNFSSDITITPNEGGATSRDALIYMNHPLRYEGLTYYQSGVNNTRGNTPGTEGTVLQVVRNPGWQLPYVAVLIVGIGMLYQFLSSLWIYGRRRGKSSKRAATPAGQKPAVSTSGQKPAVST